MTSIFLPLQSHSAPSRSNGGFTLIEVLVVVTVLIILASVAAPAFRGFIANNAMRSGVSDFVTSLQLAKADSISRTEPVTLCKKNATDDGCVTTGDWNQGWISFSDPNGNGTVDAGDEIFNVQSSFDANITLKGTAGITDLITFTPSGITNLDGVEVLVMCDGDGFSATAKGIVVTITGNASIMTATEANKTTCL